MFKQTYGFDTETFKRGVAIKVSDTKEYRLGHIVLAYSESHEFEDENMSATYIVRTSYPTELRTTNVKGEEVVFPIRHFIGDSPRMSIRVLQ